MHDFKILPNATNDLYYVPHQPKDFNYYSSNCFHLTAHMITATSVVAPLDNPCD